MEGPGAQGGGVDAWWRWRRGWRWRCGRHSSLGNKQGRVFMALAAGLALAVTLTSDSSEKTSRDENNEK